MSESKRKKETLPRNSDRNRNRTIQIGRKGLTKANSQILGMKCKVGNGGLCHKLNKYEFPKNGAF